MILSVSRRTDIPSYYSDWFINRVREGFVYVPNPMNIHAISQVDINPGVVDAIVFWSKNPQPMIDKLDAVKEYPFYFQYTLNAYGNDLEANLPALEKRILTFIKLSDMLGPERVIWRYDPILVTGNCDVQWHLQSCEYLAKRLKGFTERCVFSFLDEYKKIETSLEKNRIRAPYLHEMRLIAQGLSSIFTANGMQAETCAELIDLDEFNIKHSRCIDAELIERISGYRLEVKKDKNQRPECGCVESIDVGMYNTCANGCLYCYANYNRELTKTNMQRYDANSSLLYGQITPLDKVTVRKVSSLKQKQTRLFD